ncbi:MAG TPA: glycerol-3-phosphate dehydrogenase [Methylocella sp.]|nr:glycerol-3-phosphate dehydrogenase [Methylocella sp.]
MNATTSVDLLVIGGGVNGAGIARDAAGRGLSVLLCEQGDLAGATSSASSKLIHGGLRYLEYGQLLFVREALIERQALLRIAPHIVWPGRFILVHDKRLRPALLIEAGLFFYDHLAARGPLARSRRLDFRNSKEGIPLKQQFKTGFAYSDAQADDARLVVLNAVDARLRGAEIRTRTRCVAVQRSGGLWQASLLDVRRGERRMISARALVNAAGPWAEEVALLAGRKAPQKLRLVKGSHIIVPRLYAGEHSYVLQSKDRRIIFVMPYEKDYSLVGTTEVPFSGDPAEARMDTDEAAYLCAAVSAYFRKPLMPSDVKASFAGVRPLYDERVRGGSAASRGYVLDVDVPPGGPPLLSAFGGKVTTYRRLAEEAVTKLAPYLNPPRPKPWTAENPLPGGDLGVGGFDGFLAAFSKRYPWLGTGTARRLARAYGTRAEMILGGKTSPDGLGTHFGAGLFQSEIDYLLAEEFAITAEDVLWRRSKLGLHLSSEDVARVAEYVTAAYPEAERSNA